MIIKGRILTIWPITRFYLNVYLCNRLDIMERTKEEYIGIQLTATGKVHQHIEGKIVSYYEQECISNGQTFM